MPAEHFPNFVTGLVSPNTSHLQVHITVSYHVYGIYNINMNIHCTQSKQCPYMLNYKLYTCIIQHPSRQFCYQTYKFKIFFRVLLLFTEIALERLQNDISLYVGHSESNASYLFPWKLQ